MQLSIVHGERRLRVTRTELRKLSDAATLLGCLGLLQVEGANDARDAVKEVIRSVSEVED